MPALQHMLTSRPLVVVDDSQIDLRLAQISYQRSTLPFEFVAVNSGEALLDYLAEARAGKAALPSLILLDINMPGLNGFQVLEAVRSQPDFKDTLTITMLTHSDNPEDERRALQLGANGFKTKPAGIAAFVQFFNSLNVSL